MQAPSHATSDVVLDVRGLSKFFNAGGGPLGLGSPARHVHAVEDVSFTLRRGQILALVGESGSGKSTIARLLARLYPVTAGQVLLHGQDVTATHGRRDLLRYRSTVQMVFQDPFASLNPAKTIAHHIMRPLTIYRRPGEARGGMQQVHDLLQTVGLTPPEEVALKFPHQLSGGQRQRVAFARALAVQPEVILADEPISMLDVSIRMGILNMMAHLRDTRGGVLSVHHARPRQRPLHRRRNVGTLRGTPRRGGVERHANGRAAAPLYAVVAQRRTRPAPGAEQTTCGGARRDPDRHQPSSGLPLRQPLPPCHGRMPHRHAPIDRDTPEPPCPLPPVLGTSVDLRLKSHGKQADTKVSLA